jgi:hypothetical protein
MSPESFLTPDYLGCGIYPALEYSYFDQDADLPSDRYNEHRFLFTLSAKQDFWHW